MRHIEITVTDGKSNHDYVLHNVDVSTLDNHDVLRVDRLDTKDAYGFPFSNVVVFHTWETEDR